jgi:hypothetical protein
MQSPTVSRPPNIATPGSDPQSTGSIARFTGSGRKRKTSLRGLESAAYFQAPYLRRQRTRLRQPSRPVDAELDSIDENEKLIKQDEQKLKKKPTDDAKKIEGDIRFMTAGNEESISKIQKLQGEFVTNLWHPQEKEIGRADREDFDKLQSEANVKELEHHLIALGSEHEKIFASGDLNDRKVKRLEEIETEMLRLQQVLKEIQKGVFSPARHGAAEEGGQRRKRTSKGKKKKMNKKKKSTRRRKVTSR